MEHKYTTRPCSVTGYCLLVDAKTNGSELSMQMLQERALFIVKACNEHDGLEAIVLRLADYFDDKQSPEGTLDAIWKDAQEYRKDVK